MTYGVLPVVLEDSPDLFPVLFPEIHWEGEMFHDMSEVDLGFGHFRHDRLEGFQGDAAGY